MGIKKTHAILWNLHGKMLKKYSKSAIESVYNLYEYTINKPSMKIYNLSNQMYICKNDIANNILYYNIYFNSVIFNNED